MTSYLYLIRVFLLCSLILSGYSIMGQKVNPQNQLLWKIEGKGLKKPSYLFGTMHVKDERVFNLSDSVFIGISETDIFAAEMDMDQMLAEMIKMLFNKDTSDFLKNKLSKEEYTKLDDRIRDKLGVGLDKINTKETWMLNMFMKDYDHDKSENQRATFLDAYLYGLAKKMKRTTIGLETLKDYSRIEEEKNIETRMKTLLLQTESTSSEDVFKKLLSIYEQGDLKMIDEFRKTFPTEFMHDILIRNVNMANRMDSILKTQSMFVAMGCAHLPGDSGMIDLLRKKGYKLSPVKAVYTGLEKKYRYSNVDYSWSSYVPPTGFFAVNSPGPVVDFPVPKYESLDMKMYLTPDIYRNTYFMVITMNMGRNITPDMEDKVLNAMADDFTKRSFQSLSKKIVEENGKKRIYTVLKSTKGQYYRYMIMMQGTEVLMGAISGDKKIVIDENSDKFLSSIKFLKTQKFLIDPELMVYKDTLGAFEVLMPKIKLQEYKKIIDGEETTVEMNMQFSNVPYKGNTFYTTWYSYINGGYIVDDSISLESMYMNLSSNPDYEIKQRKNLLFKDKYKALEIIAVHKKMTYTKDLFIINGNRPYMFMVVGESEASIANESAVAFFNSIELTEYSYTNKGILYHSPDKSFHAKVYADPIVDSSQTGYFYNKYYDGINTYTFNDPASSGAYAISHYKTSPYYTIKSPGEFLDSIALVDRDTTEETVFDKKRLMMNTNPVMEYYVRSKNGKLRRYLYVLAGNGVYELVLASLDKDLTSVHANDFFNLFVPNRDFGREEEDKGERLLKDLMSSDTLKIEAARNALMIISFKQNNIPSLKNALVFDHKDAEDYYSVTRKLLDAMQNSFGKEYPAFVKEMYVKSKDKPKLQCELLSSLTNMSNDSNAFYTFLDLFTNQPPAEFFFKPYDLSAYCQSKYAVDLVEPYLDKMKDKRSRVLLMNLMGGLSDTSLVIQQKIAEHYNTMETFMTEYIMPAYRRGDTSEYYYGHQLIRVVDLFPKDKKSKWYNEFIKDKDKGLVYETMLLMVKNKLLVDPSVLNKYASDIHYVYYMYEALKKHDRLDAFPKEKLTEKNIAMGSLVSYMEEDDGIIEKISVIGEKEIVLNNSKTMVYLMKCKWDGQKEWYVGISAPGDLYGKNANGGGYPLYKITYSDFTLLSDKSTEAHFEELIKKLQEENTKND